jgi:hypothetical protein
MTYPPREAAMIFNDNWLKKEAENKTDSWANDVIGSLEPRGQMYLSTLRLWFDRFPLLKKDQKHLQRRLESLQNDEHLGGVNELAWWAFMQREGIKGKPLPTSESASPDFQLDSPAGCFVEILTLNLSEQDQKAFSAKESIALRDGEKETIRRFFAKLTGQKYKQLKHAANNGKPGVLVLFDYTTWSAFGTQFFRALGDALLGKQFEFKSLAPELSAIIYLERKVMDGRIVSSRQRSAIYHNPLAQHSLRHGLFSSLTEFSSQVVSVDSQSVEPWLWL